MPQKFFTPLFFPELLKFFPLQNLIGSRFLSTRSAYVEHVTYAVSGDDVNGGGGLVDRSDFGFRVAVGLWFWVR